MNNNNIKDKKLILSTHQFMEYFLGHEYNENMFTSDCHINPEYNSFKNTGLIPKILSLMNKSADVTI